MKVNTQNITILYVLILIIDNQYYEKIGYQYLNEQSSSSD